MSSSIIRLEHVKKNYDDLQVVKDMELDVKEGEFLTFLGPSGCGKTTTLRMIAGFEMPSEGVLSIDGKDMNAISPYKRPVNTVFQNYALFPHMTIFDNIAYGLKIRKLSKEEIREKVLNVLQLVQLSGYENRKPDQLSGGQKQRVAIARALVNEPKVLLLDEPLGALDMKLRKQMQVELKRLQRRVHITFIYVTHDQEEALTMSDRIVIMNAGRIEQIGTPKEIYNEPKTQFVADFVGESNLFYGYMGAPKENNEIPMILENGEVSVKNKGFEEGEIAYVSIRPESTLLSMEPVPGFSLEAMVKEIVFMGSVNRVLVVLQEGKELKVNFAPTAPLLEEGDTVFVHWDLENAVVIPALSEEVYRVVDNPVFTSQTN